MPVSRTLPRMPRAGVARAAGVVAAAAVALAALGASPLAAVAAAPPAAQPQAVVRSMVPRAVVTTPMVPQAVVSTPVAPTATGDGDYSSPEAPVCSGPRAPEVVASNVAVVLGTTCRTTSPKALRAVAIDGSVAMVGGSILYRSARGFTGIDRITVYVPNDDGSIRFAAFVLVDVR